MFEYWKDGWIVEDVPELIDGTDEEWELKQFGKEEKPMWKEKEQDWGVETDKDDNDSCNMDVCNDLHKVKDSCCYQNFDDNTNCTDESQCCFFEHKPGECQNCPNG